MIDSAMPARTPRPVPLPRRWSVGATEIVAVLVANGVLILGMWLRHGGLDQLVDARRAAHRDRPAHRAVRHLPGARPARPDVAQPVARPGRSAWTGLAVAHRWLGFATVWLLARPRRVHDGRLRAGRPERRRRRVRDAHHDLPVRPDGARQRSSCSRPSASARCARRAGGCRTRRGTASTCTPTSRSRSASCTSCSSAPTSCTTRSRSVYWIGLYVVDHRARPRRSASASPLWLSVRHRLARVARSSTRGPDVVSIYVTGRDLDRSPSAPGQYFVLAVPDPRRLVARPPVLDLVGAQRPLAADHGQGARRLVRGAAARPGRDAGLRRGPVRRPDRRPADAAQGPARSRAGSGSRRSAPCSRRCRPSPAT